MTFDGLNPPYATIVADPPWPYKDAATTGSAMTRSVKRDGTTARGVSDWRYSPMTLDDILALPVARLMATNAHLYVELFARQPRLGWDSWGLGYESA